MPWKIDQVEEHKKGLDDKGKRQWIAVANSVYAKCIKDGGDDKSCAPKAIQQANGVTNNDEDIGFYKELAKNYEIRYEMYKGKSRIVVPIIMMREGVHAGSHGPLLHLAEDLGKFPASWDGIPISIQHPQENGNNVSCNQPHIIDNQVVGRVFNTHMDNGKLKAEAWIDQERIQQISSEALKYIQEGKPLDVSVGVFTEDEYSTGDYNGEHYEGVAKNHRPDHLALLPGGHGACSWTDGCGVRANAKGPGWGDEARKAALEARRGGGSKGPNPASGMSLSGKATTVAEQASAVADEKGTADSAAMAASANEDAAKLAEKDGNTAQAEFHRAEAKKYRDKQAQLKTASEGDQMQTNIGRLKYDGTESTAWSGPSLQDFGLDGRWQDLKDVDRAKVAAHYLIGTSQTGSFSDLKLPVVNPSTGKLNEFALRAVISGRGSAITGVDPKEKMAAQRMAYKMLNDEFGADLAVPTTMEDIMDLVISSDLLQEMASKGLSINQMSYDDIAEEIQSKLSEKDNSKTFNYLKEVFDNYFVYCQRSKDNMPMAGYGGPGSGNFGHSGIPGQVGGSGGGGGRGSGGEVKGVFGGRGVASEHGGAVGSSEKAWAMRAAEAAMKARDVKGTTKAHKEAKASTEKALRKSDVIESLVAWGRPPGASSHKEAANLHKEAAAKWKTLGEHRIALVHEIAAESHTRAGGRHKSLGNNEDQPQTYGCEEGSLFKQSYKIVNDEIEFTGEAQPVVKKVEYITQEEQGDSIMANKEEKKPCCAEKVELLIQSEDTQFTETDREWLMAMDEGQMAKLETLANPANKAKADKLMADAKAMMEEAKKLMANSATSKEQAIQVLKEELGDQTKFLGLLPPETRATMEHGLRLYKAEREKKISHILANTNASVYTPEKLAAMSDESLDDLARAIKAPASYAPMSPQRPTNNEEILPPAGVVLDG